MTLDEIVRDQTRDVRDALEKIQARYGDLLEKKNAADDRLKKAFTEIKYQRTRENERRRLLVEIEDKIHEIQQKVDEIERQRQELIDRLMERRDEKEKAEKLLRVVIQTAESEQHTVRDARSTIDTVARTLDEVEKDKEQSKALLRSASTKSLDIYLAEVSRRLDQAYASEEERDRRQAALETFKRARHEDREIADLCDQRDEYRDLMARATVPGVKGTLLEALDKVEEELQKRYPGALSLQDTVPEVGSIAELTYVADSDEKARIFLPMAESVWRAVENGDVAPATTRAMQFVWSMISGLGLKPSDGEFRCEMGRVVFCVDAKACDVSALTSLTFSMQAPKGITFAFCPLPAEVKGALTYEG